MSRAASPSAAPRSGRLAPDRLVGAMAEGGLFLWAIVSAGVWAWAFHLLYLSAFAELACTQPVVTWTFHAATVATAVVTLAAGWVCLVTVRHCRDDEGAGTVAGRTRFLGLFGLLLNAISLALIVLEGVYVPFISPCA